MGCIDAKKGILNTFLAQSWKNMRHLPAQVIASNFTNEITEGCELRHPFYCTLATLLST